MSQLSSSEIDHLAQLARISLTSEEKERFSRELPRIAEFVETLQNAQIADTSTPVSSKTISELRSDEYANNGLTLDQLKALSPEFSNDYNAVPPVFGEQVDA